MSFGTQIHEGRPRDAPDMAPSTMKYFKGKKGLKKQPKQKGHSELSPDLLP